MLVLLSRIIILHTALRKQHKPGTWPVEKTNEKAQQRSSQMNFEKMRYPRLKKEPSNNKSKNLSKGASFRSTWKVPSLTTRRVADLAESSEKPN